MESSKKWTYDKSNTTLKHATFFSVHTGPIYQCIVCTSVSVCVKWCRACDKGRKRRCGIMNQPVATCQDHRWVVLGCEYVYTSWHVDLNQWKDRQLTLNQKKKKKRGNLPTVVNDTHTHKLVSHLWFCLSVLSIFTSLWISTVTMCHLYLLVISVTGF